MDLRSLKKHKQYNQIKKKSLKEKSWVIPDKTQT